jgi:putative phosphoribosyl transferase
MRAAQRRSTLPVMSARFRDRVDAGRHLAAALARLDLGDAVVVGLARGGVTVAAEIARRLSLPLDALAVRKIGYPFQPEYGIGAVTPGAGVGESELQRSIEQAKAKADALDRIIHEHCPPRELRGKTAVLVDDGLATGATMTAAVRWARACGARRVVVAVPVGATQSAKALRGEADEVVCPCEKQRFGAVGFWYDVFTQVENDEVVDLLRELEGAEPAPAGRDSAN